MKRPGELVGFFVKGSVWYSVWDAVGSSIRNSILEEDNETIF